MAITTLVAWAVGSTSSFSCMRLCGLVGTLIVLYLVINEIIRAKSRIKGLSGPRGLPLIGVLWDIRTNAAEQYRSWAKLYGDVYQVQLGNVTVVVVNSAEAARTLFGHNSQALSSRPEFYTFHKVLSDTAGTTIGTSPYSDSLKRRRKAAASALNRPSVASYVGILDLETRDFVLEMIAYGKHGTEAIDPMPMIQRLSLSLSVTLNWGSRIASQHDGLFAEITHVEEEISKFRSTTGNLQDYVPLLRLNPFNGHSARAREMRNRRDVYLKHLDDELHGRMAAGKQRPCIQANVILDDNDIKTESAQRLSRAEMTSISLTMLSGGLDTITTNVAWFIALLVQRPDIQEKAHLEIRKHLIDQVQPDRSDPLGLCDAEDDQGCRYIAALVRESLRYYTVLRLALPRVSVREVVHEGVVLPRGTVFFLNAWACNMDAKIWSDPEVFRPERWLEQPDAPLFTYGVGYRMCAGSLLANRELYLLYMRLIAHFKIESAPQKDGCNGIDTVDCHPVSGNCDPTSLVAIPRPYKVLFVPRDLESIGMSDA
ncbi:uncharacterized protein PgNI_00700 [Pyricularia grisea]|uniref:3-hydroxyphenylacetate 6-hydroxylase n=1 Tax=Pyricularia grisea TaxID=148305 RepID=A0A6P8BFP3_PYRGI|nr:uncharacterized protein PgNI_00700 [Pyricularia grisea]TLD15656.1 hypothetical protein PgNI_00700 [Pyricularia grisea]